MCTPAWIGFILLILLFIGAYYLYGMNGIWTVIAAVLTFFALGLMCCALID